MKRTFTRMLLCALLAVCGLTSRAQTEYTLAISDYLTSDWAMEPDTTLTLDEVGAALGFASGDDFATELQNSMLTYNSGGTPSIEVAVPNSAGEWTTTSNQANQWYWNESDWVLSYYSCFWLTADGTWETYSSNTPIWCGLRWDEGNGKLTVGIGQQPNTCQEEQVYKADMRLTHDGHEVIIHVSLTILVKPEIEGPVWQDLTVVGSQTLDLYQESHTETPKWEGMEFMFDAEPAMALLGYDAESFAAAFDTIIWAYGYDSNKAYLADRLVQESTANPIGWWFEPSVEDGADEANGVCYATTGQTGFYTEYFRFDPDTMGILGNIGQNYYGIAGGKTLFTEVWLVNGTLAYKLILNFHITSPKQWTLPEMTKVGEQDITFTQLVRGDYTADTDTLDLAHIRELLGCSTNNEVILRCLQGEEISTNYTASAPGFWLDADSKVVAYADGYYFVEYDQTNGVVRLGQMPSKLTEGSSYKATLLLTYQGNYYQLNVTFNLPVRQRVDVADFKPVRTIDYDIQIKPSSTDWNTSVYTPALSANAVLSELGHALVTLYGELPDTVSATGDSVIYTMGYTCTPYPGFWFSDDGKVSTYGDATRIALTYNETGRYFEVIQKPGYNQTGQEYDIRQYLVADSTGNMYAFNFHITFVDEIVNYTEVGSDTAYLNLGTGEDEVFLDFDPTDLLTALGCTEEEFSENGTIQTAINTARYGHADWRDEVEGFWYAADGSAINPLDVAQLDNQLYCVNYLPAAMSDNGETQLRAYAFSLPADNESYTARLAFVYGAKRYVLTVCLLSESGYTAIEGIGSTAGASSLRPAGTFDLSGRRVSRPTRGLYIQNGRKVLVR